MPSFNISSTSNFQYGANFIFISSRKMGWQIIFKNLDGYIHSSFYASISQPSYVHHWGPEEPFKRCQQEMLDCAWICLKILVKRNEKHLLHLPKSPTNQKHLSLWAHLKSCKRSVFQYEPLSCHPMVNRFVLLLLQSPPCTNISGISQYIHETHLCSIDIF